MAKYSTVRASLWWLVSNALVEALRLRRVPAHACATRTW